MSYERVVELYRQAGVGFGFSVIGGCDTHIPPMICALVRDSPALFSGQVFVGDVLHKVNGINLFELQTKQVVDLIRSCEDKIVITLREDRLAKLKARPFLTDDILIEPISNTKVYSKSAQVSHARNNSYDNSMKVGSPNFSYTRSFDVLNNTLNTTVSSISSMQSTPSTKFVTNVQSIPSIKTSGNRPYSAFPGERVLGDSSRNGVDGKFTRLQSRKEPSPIANYKDVEPPNSPTKSFYLANSFGIPSPIMNRSKTMFNSFSTTNTNDRLEDIYLSKNLPEQEYYKHENSMLRNPSHDPGTQKSSNGSARQYLDYKAEKSISHKYNLDDLPSSPRLILKQKDPQDHFTAQLLVRNEIKNLQINGPINCSKLSDNCKKQPPITITSTIAVSHGVNYIPHTQSGIHEVNKSIQRRISTTRPCSSSDVDQIPQSTKVESFQLNNFSSPNVFENGNERIGSEHKMFTFSPYAHSAQSLQDISNKQYIFGPEQNSSAQGRVCNTYGASFDMVVCKNSDVASFSKTTDANSVVNKEISAAEIASHLYMLNGYKDTDIAPMLGKNTELSQQICKEYLQFYTFDGLTLDGALRMFLGNFPLTGETQERERILIHFSKRYMECNSHCDMSEDAVHTLVCSLMLLNTDLHGQGVTNRMTLNDFINNLSGLCDGKDFPKEQLKTLYNSIKSKKMVFASSAHASSLSQSSPKHKRKLKVDSKDRVICEGYLNRKSVMDSGGRRTSAMKRNWRQFYCFLKGIILISQKPDNMNDAHSIGIHHALAGYAKDYKKRAYVFKIIAADWSVYYIQAKNQDDARQWIDCINVAAAMLSSPPLPAPVSSSTRFQRPVMPVSKTKLTKVILALILTVAFRMPFFYWEQQLRNHFDQVKSLEEELIIHSTNKPDLHEKHYSDWENKYDYLEFEIKRFKAYCSYLTTPRWESIRQLILASLSQDVTLAADDHLSALSNKSIKN